MGVGGSAANASHAVNDFRKIVGLEAYTPTDHVAELTVRTDEGWASVFAEWLRVSRLRADDLVLVFSVDGGNVEKNVSPNLVVALQYAQQVGARHWCGRTRWRLYGAGGRCLCDYSHGQLGTCDHHTEAFQAVVWHLLVSHPVLKAAETKWESVR